MDLRSSGYPKRSPGVWDGSLRSSMAASHCFAHPLATSSKFLEPIELLAVCAIVEEAVYRNASGYY